MISDLIISLLVITVTLSSADAIECTDFSEIKGLVASAFTPVDENTILKTDIIPQYAQYLIDYDIDGVLVAAASGEGPTMNVSDNNALLEAWMAVAPSLGLFVIADVGAVPLPDAQDRAAYAEELGVDALMVLPPVYYRPETAEELVDYLLDIYEAAPNTNMIYDDNPQYTDVYVDMEEFFELATEQIPTFKGVKTHIFETALLLQELVEDDQRIFIDDYIYSAPGILMGFDSLVLPELNLYPELISDIFDYAQNGSLAEAQSDYYELLDLMDDILEEGDEIAAKKRAFVVISGLDVGDVRPPLVPLTEEEDASLQERLQEQSIPPSE